MLAEAVHLVALGPQVSHSSNEAMLGASSGRSAAISQQRKQGTTRSMQRERVHMEQAHHLDHR